MNGENNQQTIFIIDDDNFLLGMYSEKFIKMGFMVETAGSGSEALKKLREGLKPYVIVLDVVMPNQDGLQIVKLIAEEGLAPEAKIILLTNQSDPEEVEKAKTLPIAGYIIKADKVPSQVVEEVLSIAKGSRPK